MVNLVCKVSGGREEFNHFAGQSMGRVFYAELDMASGRNVAGCPCGRGSTESEAVEDLSERIARENGPAFKFSLACPSLTPVVATLTLDELIRDARLTADQDHANAYDENGDTLASLHTMMLDGYQSMMLAEGHSANVALSCAAAYADEYTNIIRAAREAEEAWTFCDKCKTHIDPDADNGVHECSPDLL